MKAIEQARYGLKLIPGDLTTVDELNESDITGKARIHLIPGGLTTVYE